MADGIDVPAYNPVTLTISMPDVQMPAPMLHLDTSSAPKVNTLGAALATG